MRVFVLFVFVCLLGLPIHADPLLVATHPPQPVPSLKKDQYAVSATRILRANSREVVILDPATGVQTGSLLAPEGWSGPFANAITMEGDRALICQDGVPFWTRDAPRQQEESLLYDLNSGAVTVRFAKPKVDSGNGNWGFGDACVIEGDIVAIAMPGDDSRRRESNKKIGSVLVYDARTGALKHRIHSPYPQDTAAFGKQIFLSKGRLLVSQSGGGWNPDARAAIYAFDVQSGALIDTAFELEPGSQWFFRRFALDGDQLAVSLLTTHRAQKKGVENRTLLVDLNTGDPVAGFPAPDPGIEGFGVALAFQDERLLIGARADHGTNEHVFLFDSATGSLLETFTPETPGTYFGINLAVSRNTVLIEHRMRPEWEETGRAALIYRLPIAD
ncbi:hypothetical protein SAMN04488078_10079 [Antarctobacter heliothermus]|uniref:Uncharacterized protein n=2 Tax=Antarctobacter heliothermus TaxID=74033 RepID=A0A239CI79_9RHOB|nr:hypothetical protein SAMN04488078_10079 [Antarctobacter heliothermus]